MKNPKVLIWIAIISIALNLALLGFLLGQATRPLPGFDPTRGYAHWVRSLPETRQAELRPLFQRSHGQNRPPRLRSLHREFRTTLTAEPFDPTAMQAALENLRTGHSARLKDSHLAFIEFVSKLSVNERHALAEDLAQPRRTRPRSRRPNRLP